MSVHRSRSAAVWPGTGRITLAMLAVVPALMAYPWGSTRSYWLLGIAALVMIVLFGWWRGLYLTTILRRRLAMIWRRSRPVSESDSTTRTTVLLRMGPSAGESDVLPLPLIAQYLNCYGIRADTIRITSRNNESDGARCDTWIGLTLSAEQNLAALQARSSRIPLRETAQAAARRLADHLREIGWEVSTAGLGDVPRLITEQGDETWYGIENGSDYLAAYRISIDDALPGTLDAIRSYPARVTWTVLEIAGPGSSNSNTIAAACVFLTDTAPQGTAPLAGLTSQLGNHRPALAVLDLLSTQRLDGHTDMAADLLTRLRWPAPAVGVHRAPRPKTSS
ncbi:type VII secretion protein EccE3 [Mycobacterium uberis]|uniref:Type VII secretion protein EccE3 n=1 Tax=Mycobacterium uberis TaxID=2162698 RepID=A0A3E1HEL4_9MYCO|nr:type VII secretion protein EccE [Mycobacterium uberis]RFD24714.1 type VII secretion protein EccE3 [Mycobacterium uberis]